MNDIVEALRKEGYPLIIKGNGGYKAVLCGIQPLIGGYAALYRYPGGVAVHDLSEIKMYFEIVEE